MKIRQDGCAGSVLSWRLMRAPDLPEPDELVRLRQARATRERVEASGLLLSGLLRRVNRVLERSDEHALIARVRFISIHFQVCNQRFEFLISDVSFIEEERERERFDVRAQRDGSG